MSVPQQIKDRLDIVQYIQEHVPGLKKRGRYYKANCPFHSENTPSFVVNPETQSWRCFGACAEGGDLFTFAQKMHGWTFPEALRELGRQAGVEVQQRTPRQQARDEHLDKLRGMLDTVAEYYHEHLHSDDPKAQRALYYARRQRGFSQETIDGFQIGYAPDAWRTMLDMLTNLGYEREEVVEAGVAIHNDDKDSTYDRFRNRLVIPICDERGRVVGFGGRILNPDDFPKYLNSPQTDIFDKSGLLYGLDKAKRAIRETETAVIVEGYMDVIQAHQAGYENVVAQMGTAMTEEQLKLIAPRYAKRIIMALDADDAGQNATRRSLEVARKALEADYVGKLEVDIRVLQIDGAKDPDDVLRETPEKWRTYVDNAVPVAEFVINMETAGLDTHTSVQEKQRIAADVLPLLTASENDFYRQENLQRLALRLRISEGDLLTWARELQRDEAAKARRRQQRQQRQRDQVQEQTPPPSKPASALPTTHTDDHQPPPVEYDADGFVKNGSSSEPPPNYIPAIDDRDEDFYTAVMTDDDGRVEQLAPNSAAPPRAEALKGFTAFNMRYSSRPIEEKCLWFMLHHLGWLTQVNRALRELSGDADAILDDLRELKQEDFTQGDYKVILATLIDALSQDDEDTHTFIRQTLDPALEDTLDELLVSAEAYIKRQVNNRFAGEVEAILTAFMRRVQVSGPQLNDLLFIALIVKKYRVQRDIEELRFLLLEQADDDLSARAKRMYNETFNDLRKTLHAIDTKIDKYRKEPFSGSDERSITL